MKKTWISTVVVIVAAAAVAFWVFFDRQSAPEAQIDTTLNAMPAWQVIKEQEPALHQRILDQMAALQKAGEPEQHIIDTIQPQILHLQMTRLQNAPDANVVNYMTINMEQTAAIQKVSDDDISPRIKHFGEIEATLISTPDNEFRFHSGVPV